MIAAETERKLTSSENQLAILRLLNRPDPTIIDSIILTLNDPDPLVRHAAAWALNPLHLDIIDFQYDKGVSQIQPSSVSRIEEVLLSALTEENYFVKIEIINALLELQNYKYANKIDLNKSIMLKLLHLAKDPDPDIRSAVIKGLHLWKDDPEAKSALLSSLADEDRHVRRASLGPGVFELSILAELLIDPDYQLRFRAIRVIANDYPKDPRTVDILIKAIKDPNVEVISQAIYELGRLKNLKAVKPLLGFYVKNGKYNIESAIEEITGKSFDEVFKKYNLETKKEEPTVSRIEVLNAPKWLNAIKEGKQERKKIAIHNLSLSQKKEAVLAILNGLNDADPEIRYTSSQALQYYINPESDQLGLIFKYLMNRRKDPNSFVRRGVVETISYYATIGSYRFRVFKILDDIVEDNQDPFVRLNSIKLPSSYKYDEDAIEKLYLKLMKDEFPEIRAKAIYGTSLVCHPESIESVLEALRDPLYRIRRYAVKTLGHIGVAEANDYRKIKVALQEVSKKDSSETIRNSAEQSLMAIEFQQNLRMQKKGCIHHNGSFRDAT